MFVIKFAREAKFAIDIGIFVFFLCFPYFSWDTVILLNLKINHLRYTKVKITKYKKQSSIKLNESNIIKNYKSFKDIGCRTKKVYIIVNNISRTRNSHSDSEHSSCHSKSEKDFF